MSDASPLGGNVLTGSRPLTFDLPAKPPPPPSSIPASPTPVNVPLPDCIDSILPAQFDPTHQGSMKPPHGFIRYLPRPDETGFEASEEEIRKRHTEEVFYEIMRKIEETFDASYDELSDDMSVSGILKDQMDQVGLDGALRYLRKFVRVNEDWSTRTRARLDSTQGKAKGKARQDFLRDDDVEMDDEENLVGAMEEVLDEERLEVFLRIKGFVHEASQRRDVGVMPVWGCDKLGKLIEVLSWMKREAESKPTVGESRWNCLVVAPNDQIVRSIHHALQSTQSILSVSLTSQAIFDQAIFDDDEADLGQKEAAEGRKMRKVTVDFALAEYNVLIVTAVKAVEWMVSPCHIIHYDPVEPEVARTIPPQWNTMTKEGNRFFVFKRLDGGKGEVRVEDVRLERSYGLRDRSRGDGEIAFPIKEDDWGKSMDDLLAEAGMVVDRKPRVLTQKEIQALTPQGRTQSAEQKTKRRVNENAFQEKQGAVVAKGLPPPKKLSKKKKLKLKRKQALEAELAAAREAKKAAHGPKSAAHVERKQQARKDKLEKRQKAREDKLLQDNARRAANREVAATRLSTLRSATGTRFEKALETVNFADDIGPMKDDGSEESAVWSSTDDGSDEDEVSHAKKAASVKPIVPEEEDELDELDDEDMSIVVSASRPTTSAMETPPETHTDLKDVLDEETISMVLEDQDDLKMEDPSADEDEMRNGRSQFMDSTAQEAGAEAGADILMPLLSESSRHGESSRRPSQALPSVIPDWRVYTQEELGLPRLGLAMPRKGATATQDYTGPSGRKLHFEREWNGNREHHVKNTCFSWPQLSNSASTAIVSPKSAADIFQEVQIYCQNSVVVQDADPEVLGARAARRLWVDLPPHMIRGSIVSDAGNKGKRGLEILHFTVVAALYMAGWLDHGFNLLYHRPTLGNGVPWPSPVSNPTLRLASPASGSLLENSIESATRSTARNPEGGGRVGQAADAQHQAMAGLNSRTVKGLPVPNKLGLVDIEDKKPKFWNRCENNEAGSFCAVLCRIKIPGNTRRFRTVCILTRERFKIPLGRSLPTCKALPDVEVVLATGQDVSLDKKHWKAAHDYTLELFSVPRKRQLHAVPGHLPYYILPMSSGWQAADEATSEISIREAANVESNIAWTEVFAGLKGKVRVLSGFETGGQGLLSLAEEALYHMNGSAIPYEVGEIVRDADARGKAQSRVSSSGNPDGRGSMVVDGPVFVIQSMPDLWFNGPQAPAGNMRTVTISPKHEPISSLNKSIHQSAQLLPWIMWTIDGLLLAQEVNATYLGGRADSFDVLAALSTTASGRTIDCEVLEFAGDTYWKLAATAYFYYTSPHRIARELNEQVRSVTDNAPLALGMQECRASEYILNAPVNPSAFAPYGCGIRNFGDLSISYPVPRVTRAGKKAIADASEALAGAVGKLKDHELIQQVCTALQPNGLPSAISWEDLAGMPSLDFGSIKATSVEVDEIYALTGHSFANRSMLDMILRNKPRGDSEQTAAARMIFLGTAVFEYLLMAYLVDQGKTQNLGPGELTRWRNSMYSHIAMATLWVASGLSKHIGDQTRELSAKLNAFEKQLKKTIDTRTESTMAWTRIANPPRAENHVHGLFGGVLIDSGWSFDAARAVFNKFCLPFFARFVGSYDRTRLAPLPDTSTAARRLASMLKCRYIAHNITCGYDGLYRATVYSHKRSLGEGSSVYESAALSFAYRDAFVAATDRGFDRNTCPCHQPVGNLDTRAGVVDLTREEQASEPSARSKRPVKPIKQDAESDDDFEIIDDPKTVTRAQQIAPVASGSRVRTSSDVEDSDRGHGKKCKL